MITLYNNEFVEELKIPITSSAFHYGYGVFETILYRGEFKEQERHIKRLFNSAEAIHLEIKNSPEEITSMLKKLESKLTKHSRVKLIAIEEGIIITAIDLNLDPNLQNGVALKSVKQSRSYSHAKTLSYLDSFLPNRIAQNAGFYDALLVNEEGNVTECSYANIFWFEGDVLCTTKEDILPGITRQKVIENSPFKVEYKNISLENILNKKEVFLTQSTKGILPIIKIDDKVIGEGKPGKNTLTLRSIL